MGFLSEVVLGPHKMSETSIPFWTICVNIFASVSCFLTMERGGGMM